jgi:DUF971 family protein
LQLTGILPPGNSCRERLDVPQAVLMASPVPTSIQKKSETEMSIAWNTGENSTVLFTELRFQCRCAECVDEWTRKRRISREQVRKDVKPVHVEAVGRYAIQIDWNDGHKTGIYPYELLYAIATGRHSKDEKGPID